MRQIATVRDLCNLAAYVNAGNDCAGLTFKLVGSNSGSIANCTANVTRLKSGD